MATGRAGVSGALLLVLCISAVQHQVAQARHRYNLHEPLFADDDSTSADSHTVSAGPRRPAPVPSNPPVSPARHVLSSISSVAPPNEHKLNITQTRAAPPVTPPASSKPSKPSRLTTVELQKVPSTAKRQIATPVVVLQDAPIAQQQLNSRTGSTSNHWSALRNYYDKLRPATWEDARARLPPSAIADSQQKVYDTDGLQQQQKQIYTVEPTLIRYPSPNGLKSPFELPTQGSQLPPSADFRTSQTALVRLEPIAQQPISDWALDFPELPDKIFFNQQQTRARHQQDTFGSLVDRGIQEQLQQEEMSCGPRNVVRNLVAGRRQFASFGEYPSHMGLYNESRAGDSSFICSATLLHSRFALTLASCLTNLNASSLFVRTADWNVNRKINESDREFMMMVRQVARVHPFPRFQGNEHNLALLEWTKPIEFPASKYISPACQAQSRSSLRMRSCFAPVRNITVSAYFDAEGDGETKLRQDVQMVEVPINLVANDDAECRRQTLVEAFNFQHPNYICSGDFRQTQWRAKLRQSQYLGSGVYCDEGGMMSLVSMMHPMQVNPSADFGYLDLSFYRPWMQNVIASQAGFIRYSQ